MTADWKGGTEAQMKSVVSSVAGMHRKWWARTQTDPATSWIKASRGLNYAKFVTGFIAKEPGALHLIAALRIPLPLRALGPA